MKITTIDNKHYINLGDLDHLIRKLQWDINDKYIRDSEGNFIQKDGTFGLTHDDAITKAAYTHVFTKAVANLIHACESPDEVRKLHNSLESEFYWDKYVITLEGEDEDGKKRLVFFRKLCMESKVARLKEAGKTDEEIGAMIDSGEAGDPVFSLRDKDAEFFESHDSADSMAEYIRHNYGMDVKIDPAWYYDRHAKQRLMDLIDNDEQTDDRGADD